MIPGTASYTNPMKLYEYMAVGKAVVAPDQPTVTEVVTHGENVYLFTSQDADSLAGALETVINSPDLRERLGANAAALAPDFTWERRGELMQGEMQKMLVLNG